jgi:ribosomal protein S18 acetylase RimI-like enzyme
VNFRQIEYGSAEYDAARELREAVLRAPLGLSLSANDLRGEEHQLHYALFTGTDELVGCVIVVPASDGQARIRQMAIAPVHQRQGLASRMMLELEANLITRGFCSLSLHARRSAIGFYQKLGYECSGGEFIEVTLPHRKMSKRLT